MAQRPKAGGWPCRRGQRRARVCRNRVRTVAWEVCQQVGQPGAPWPWLAWLTPGLDLGPWHFLRGGSISQVSGLRHFPLT